MKRVVRGVERGPGEVALLLPLRLLDHLQRLVYRVGRSIDGRGRGHAVDGLGPAEIVLQVPEIRMSAGIMLPAMRRRVVLAAAQVPLAQIGRDTIIAEGGGQDLGQGDLLRPERGQAAAVGAPDPGTEAIATGQHRRPRRRAPRARPGPGEQDAPPGQGLQVRHRRRRGRCLLPRPQWIEACHVDPEIVGDQQQDVRSRGLRRRGHAQPDDGQTSADAHELSTQSTTQRCDWHAQPPKRVDYTMTCMCGDNIFVVLADARRSRPNRPDYWPGPFLTGVRRRAADRPSAQNSLGAPPSRTRRSTKASSSSFTAGSIGGGSKAATSSL